MKTRFDLRPQVWPGRCSPFRRATGFCRTKESACGGHAAGRAVCAIRGSPRMGRRATSSVRARGCHPHLPTQRLAPPAHYAGAATGPRQRPPCGVQAASRQPRPRAVGRAGVCRPGGRRRVCGAKSSGKVMSAARRVEFPVRVRTDSEPRAQPFPLASRRLLPPPPGRVAVLSHTPEGSATRH